jgi:precorrin-6A synthase
MRRILIIGIGTGNPEHLTLEALNALKTARVIFVTAKGNRADELEELRKGICERYLPPSSYRLVTFPDPERDRQSADYHSAVAAWHESRAELYEKLLTEHVAEDERAAFLAWGDPTLYDSILRIMETLRDRGSVDFEYEVIPGITSAQVLAARHRIPLNQIGGAIQITTGRRLAAEIAAGELLDDDVLVMLDGDCTFSRVTDQAAEIYWGAYLGMPGEMLVSGKVSEVAERIRKLRTEARASRGWIMDTYLLRKPRAD